MQQPVKNNVCTTGAACTRSHPELGSRNPQENRWTDALVPGGTGALPTWSGQPGGHLKLKHLSSTYPAALGASRGGNRAGPDATLPGFG